MKEKNFFCHRLFSHSMYKSLQLLLARMTFTKDFVTDTRGDLYPLLRRSDDCAEQVAENRYTVLRGEAERMMCGFFPFATYEVTFSLAEGCCGFGFFLPDAKAEVRCQKDSIAFSCGDEQASIPFSCGAEPITLLISCRPGVFDLYEKRSGKPEYLTSFRSPCFQESNRESAFRRGYVTLLASAGTTVFAASSCMDCGISQADIRPIRYENGDVMMEQGKIYLTMSIRMQEENIQGIFSWVPGTAEFALTGTLFFDVGDGLWRNYLASSLLYHRPTETWYIWTSSFAHKHILAHGAFQGDPRFGVNVIDVELVEEASGGDLTDFAGRKGDEDPDFYFDPQENAWYMAVCRVDPTIQSYRYLFFRSQEPFSGYQFIGQSLDGSETGGSFVKFRRERIFVCGNSFQERANYRIYSRDGMQNAVFDFDDGGFRGWGTVIPVKMGSRERYFWLTFDRHNGSSYNWSYGNIYCFEVL